MPENKIITADVREGIEGAFHTCVTSPPYWGLRDYGVNGQIGLEASPEEYTQTLVEVFREVRRALRDDGTLWLNLGDSYAAGGKGGGGSFMKERKDAAWQHRSKVNGWRPPPEGLKPKDLVGIPWRVALALQADGWYLRSDIIWHKPNPMPESVTDRPTSSHEYLFLLSKSARYYYDAEAIREESVTEAGTAGTWAGNTDMGLPNKKPNLGGSIEGFRNKRDVWTVTTQPYAGAHFATFPPKLIEPCILAGSPKGGHVLDPFGGAGTTGLVADRLGRKATLYEINPEYAQMARERIYDDAPLFAQVSPCLRIS